MATQKKAHIYIFEKINGRYIISQDLEDDNSQSSRDLAEIPDLKSAKMFAKEQKRNLTQMGYKVTIV